MLTPKYTLYCGRVLIRRNAHYLRSIAVQNNARLENCIAVPVYKLSASNYGKSWIHLNNGLWEKVQFNLSDIGEGISEVVIKEWFVKVEDKVNQFQPICEVQSDKASVTITSRYDGIIKKIYYEVDDTAKVGRPLVEIELEDGEDTSSDSSSDEEVVADTSFIEPNERLTKVKVLTTPAVRRFAAENKIDLNQVKGTGKDGRIMKEDVISVMSGADSIPEIKVMSTPQTKEVKLDQVSDKIVAIKGIQKAMVKTMTKSLAIPRLGLSEEINLNHLMKIKGLMKSVGEENNVKISFMPFFIKAASLALTKYPILNSWLDEKCENITIKGCHNIGIAMDTKDGLIVPNVKNVQNLTIIEIAREINELQDLASKGKLGSEHLSGSTFTLSNIGSIGGLFGIPVIVSPEVVIGALGRINVLPRFDDDRNVIEGNIMNVLWSADHRVIDGATITRFSNLFKLYLESPASMIMYMK